MNTHKIKWFHNVDNPRAAQMLSEAPAAQSDTTAASLPDDPIRQKAWCVAAAVPDPEIPALTIEELGILRTIDVNSHGAVVARLSPTYSGCPAVSAIEDAVKTALIGAGYQATVERVLSPAWTTDWITATGREKLKAYGIAPPERTAASTRSLFNDPDVACPRCDSTATDKISEFGSTACKAHYRCRTCSEPFDYFKCL